MAEVLNAITWQHLVFLFFLVFIFVFRGPIATLLPRIKKIGKDGVTTESSPEVQLEKHDPEAVQQLLDVVGTSIVISDIEKNIKDDLIQRGLEANSDTAKILIRHLAGTRLLLSFEQIHSLIFGSQIFLLKKLNVVAGQGRSIEFVHAHIDHIKSLYSDQLSTWSYEQYLAFLYGKTLIIRDGNTVHITNLGVEYLTWIARNGRKENSPL